MVKNLVEQCVDCNFSCFNNNLSDFNRHLSYFHRNVSHFDRLINTFISPIQLAAKLGRHEELLLLYEHRNSPTKLQLEKRWTFYINHYDRLHREGNEILFDYTVSRLLYTRITTEHTKIVFDNLIPALRDIDNASHRGRSLSDGSRPEIFLQVRIYTLVRTIIDKKINKDDHMIEIIEKELLHNLETYYFIIGILLIPVNITKPMMNQSFSRIKSSQSLLMKYYRKIAKNLISKIKQLEINDEYTIPTGWKEHAVCVSFRRISQTHFIIRNDNPSSKNPPNIHERVWVWVWLKVDLWSEENIKVLKENYDHISNNFEGLHDLIETGPNTISLKRFKLPSDLFTLYKISDEIEFLTFLKEVQEPITTRENFQTLLDNYDSFANLNRQSAAHGSIIWKLKRLRLIVLGPVSIRSCNPSKLFEI
ncbi:unnamed protein product [Rotaria sp. Silwood1]|nr:unnamed protein product [Rotaria sp. Silwood1]